MYAFSSPGILKGAFDAALARDGPKWLLVTPKGNGFLETRHLAHLNHSTTPTSSNSSSNSTSAEGRPCFWFDSDWDRKPHPWSDLLAALLSIEPKPPLRRTGRTQNMSMPAEEGGEREAVEVEVLLDEEELCHVCFYCGDLDTNRVGEAPFAKVAGKGYASTYACSDCAALPLKARNAKRSERAE
ncbi:hypothetical protein R3P38DRAFT_3385341 [Favolaschia claudopus]|uniref:Uncharacterized protein n=1 Tax=Favolaschia claudopus TaxID=2862362 RepID=A0AAW0DWE6_9AGAR